MGGRASKLKGKKFEGDICKLLNKIFDTKEFRRTPSSGAIMGRSNWQLNDGLEDNTKLVLSSDIIVPSDFPFAIECKSYADSPIYHTFIKSNEKTLDGWLGEALFDALNTKRVPMLFFKTNNKGTHLALPRSEFESSINKHVSQYVIYNAFIIIGEEQYERCAHQIKDIAIKKLDWILEDINPATCSMPYGDHLHSILTMK